MVDFTTVLRHGGMSSGELKLARRDADVDHDIPLGGPGRSEFDVMWGSPSGLL
jgi:hypothetical protein